MIPVTKHEEAIQSAKMETNQASIEMTPEMYDMLSSKVYSNKVLAVVREIICNARDAQKEAGIDKEVLVHLPNKLEPYFSVRDYGTGLSHDMVMNLYLSYGKSTKASSNDLIGGLGIGSKSPLAYTDSFIVESFYNNVKRTYSVFKDKGIPCVSKLSEKITDEPNGLHVKVSVKEYDNRSFINEAEAFLKYFDYPVKVVGCTDLDLTPEVLHKGDGFTVYDGYRRVSVRMGGVVYRTNLMNDILKQIKTGHVIVDFNIGELSVAASREALSEDEETTKKLEVRAQIILATMRKLIVDGLPTKDYKDVKDYLSITLQNSSYYYFDSRRQEYSFPEWLAGAVGKNGVSVEEIVWMAENVYVDKYLKRSSKFKTSKISLQSLPPLEECLFVEKDIKTSFNKVLRYVNQSFPNKDIYLIDEGSDEHQCLEWYFEQEIAVLKMSDLKEKYVPKNQPTPVNTYRASGVFDRHGNEVKELDKNTEGYYFEFSYDDCVSDFLGYEYKFKDLPTVIASLRNLSDNPPDFYLVRKTGLKVVNKTKLKKFDQVELTKYLKENLKGKEKEVKENYYISKFRNTINTFSYRYKSALIKEFKDHFPIISKVLQMESRPNTENLPSFTPTNVINDIFDNLTDTVVKEIDEAAKEEEKFTGMFKLAQKAFKYGVDDQEMLDDVVNMYKIKFQTKAEEK